MTRIPSTGDAAQHRCQRGDDQGDDQGDQDQPPPAVQHLAQDVAAEDIGAQRRLPARFGVGHTQGLVDPVRGDPRPHHRGDDQNHRGGDRDGDAQLPHARPFVDQLVMASATNNAHMIAIAVIATIEAARVVSLSPTEPARSDPTPG